MFGDFADRKSLDYNSGHQTCWSASAVACLFVLLSGLVLPAVTPQHAAAASGSEDAQPGKARSFRIPSYSGRFVDNPNMKTFLKNLPTDLDTYLGKACESMGIPKSGFDTSLIHVLILDVDPLYGDPDAYKAAKTSSIFVSGYRAEGGINLAFMTSQIARGKMPSDSLHHEFVHVIHRYLIDPKKYHEYPTWIWEGLAMWFAKEKPRRVQSQLFTHKTETAILEKLNGLEDARTDKHEVADYLEDYYAMEFMAQVGGGAGAVARFNQAVIDGKDYRESIKELTRLDWPEFKTKAHEYAVAEIKKEITPTHQEYVKLSSSIDNLAMFNKLAADFLARNPSPVYKRHVEMDRVRAHYWAHQPNETIALAKEFLAVKDPPETGLEDNALLLLAMTCSDQGRHEEALEALERLASYYPDSGSFTPMCYLLQIKSLRHLGRSKEALAMAKKSLERFPQQQQAGDLASLIKAQEGAGQNPADVLDREPVLSDEGGAMPVRVIDGRLVVTCDLSGRKLRVPVNLWLDFDGAYGFQLHDRAAGALPAETPDGRSLPLTLHFADFTLTIPRREKGPEKDFENFTKYNSKALGENAVVGAVGADVLKHFDVIFDLPREQVFLKKPGGLAGRTSGQTEREILTEVTVRDGLVWLPVDLDGAKGRLKRAMAVGSSRYDTLIDSRLCSLLQRPAGDVGPLRCEAVDFAPYVAFRPAKVTLSHPDGVAGVMGNNLLANFRVHIDRESRLATLQAARDPSFPDEELAFFRAMVARSPQGLLAWLKDHGQSRLGPEAAELLLALLSENGAGTAELVQAIQWINDTAPGDLRASRMFDLMEELVEKGSVELGIAAGKLGVKSARTDRYPEANYKLHGRLGELLLPTDNREAWRHLLSAAFGMPEDGMINLNLGRCYEADGRLKRAFSRYVQALIKEGSSELALEALARLDAKLPADQRMSIEIIDRMISGRVRNFSAPDKYTPEDPGKRSTRTSVVEFFTNAYFGTELQSGAIGGAMGYQGLISHFGEADCVFLSYHLPAPRVDPLVTPLAEQMAHWLDVRSPAVQVVDGALRAPCQAYHYQAKDVYQAVRDAVASRLERPTEYDVQATGELDSNRVKGRVVVKGPSKADVVVQVVIAERGVVFHGSTGVVIHRMLARGLATKGSLKGVPFKPDAEGQFELKFDRSLTELETENLAHLARLGMSQATGVPRLGSRIEPNSVEVIVLVREAGSGVVCQARRCTLTRPEQER